MSYGGQPGRAQRGSNASSVADKQRKPQTTGSFSAAGEDTRKLKEAVEKIVAYASDIRKETRTLKSPTFNVAQSKLKVQTAAQAASTVKEQAESTLKDFVVSGSGLSREEQHHRKATQQKLSEGLLDSWKGLQAALTEYEEAEAEAERPSTQIAAGSKSTKPIPGLGPRTRTGSNKIEMGPVDAPSDLEAGQQAALQEQDVTVAEVNHHTAMVEETAAEVTHLAESIQTYQRCMADVAELVQQQGDQLDNIESNFIRAADDMSGGREQLLVASQSVRRRMKWQCWILAIAIVLSIVLVVVLVTKK